MNKFNLTFPLLSLLSLSTFGISYYVCKKEEQKIEIIKNSEKVDIDNNYIAEISNKKRFYKLKQLLLNYYKLHRKLKLFSNEIKDNKVKIDMQESQNIIENEKERILK